MILKHTTSNVNFQHLGTFKPQFTTIEMVKLLNLKTNKVETFNNETFMKYFRKVA